MPTSSGSCATRRGHNGRRSVKGGPTLQNRSSRRSSDAEHCHGMRAGLHTRRSASNPIHCSPLSARLTPP